MPIKLDYSLETVEKRKELVENILRETPEPSARYLEILADYLLICMDKEEKKERRMLTEHRMATITKREVSFEGLMSKLENGEDGIYNLITDNKNTIFRPKISITKKDLEEIEPLRQLREAISFWEEKMKTSSGKDAFIIKKTIIEMRKEQYIVKDAYRKPILIQPLFSTAAPIQLDSKEWLEYKENGSFTICWSGLSFLDEKVCSAILCNYAQLKQGGDSKFQNDTWFLIESFDNLYSKALLNYPLYERIVIYKIDGLQNITIQQKIEEEFGIRHSLEYISSLWRNKIPKLIAEAALEDWLVWVHTFKMRGKWKRCSRCGQVKLAHNRFFSLNRTSKDGFYSICKKCRNSKSKAGRN